MKIVVTVTAWVTSALGAALVFRSARSVPAPLAVSSIAPGHSPLTSRGSHMSFSSALACAITASHAPRVRPGNSPNDRLAAEIISSSQSRSEEHTSELQSLMRISYAVFCLKKKKKTQETKQKLKYNTTIKRTHTI